MTKAERELFEAALKKHGVGISSDLDDYWCVYGDPVPDGWHISEYQFQPNCFEVYDEAIPYALLHVIKEKQ